MNIGSYIGNWLSCSQTSGTCGYSNDVSQATKFYIIKLSSDVYQLQVFNSLLFLKNSNEVMSISSSSASNKDSGFIWTRSSTNCQLNSNFTGTLVVSKYQQYDSEILLIISLSAFDLC